RAIAAAAVREVGGELEDAAAEVEGQAQDRAQLDHDRKRLPVGVAEIDAEQGLADSQVRRGADRQELGQPLDDAQHDGEQVVAHWTTFIRTTVGESPARSPENGHCETRSPDTN